MEKTFNGSAVRQYIVDNGVLLWKIADKLGICDSSFSRKLRYNFSEEEYNRIVHAVEELKEEQ